MSAPQAILDLVARFAQQLDAYKSGQYNETQVRREFLDPFFKALGWDIDNVEGYAEAYKDVIHEDSIKIGEAAKAPDYCFRIGGTRKFFLEAKKPSVDIKHDVHPAFQLRRYAWTTKLPLSVLSDFEEFAVYDCRVKPDQNDNAATARVLYVTFREYPQRWGDIAGIFSRDAVLKGSFDKFAESSKLKRGTADVDEEFLQTIETWRKELAQNLALRNKNLTQRELNFAVQRIIDRIIFLRICEGRGIEDYGHLRGLVNGDRIYPRLAQLFEAADNRYNSGLFHFKREKDRHEAPDELTLSLEVDDKLLRDIIKGLYYPESPYVFSALPADILGHVYEQFLGKVIRLTESHQAKVDEKPEVKKAGGVYYTPTYIVDYIVQQTVGKLVEGKTPKQVSQIRILDPACGSGSFLIGAYQFLLDWHRDFYVANDPQKWARGGKPALVQTGAGWKLTIAERKRILLNNVYGVDIDTQAVEVTKLSLLLKVLEGETGQTLQTVFRLFHERALPDLGDNIKCGNSLIGPDFYAQQQMTLLDDEERYRINVFDWQKEFPQVFGQHSSPDELRETPTNSVLDFTYPGVALHGAYAYKKKRQAKPTPDPTPLLAGGEGGFDAVIGNPPYVVVAHDLYPPVVLNYLRQFLVAQYKLDLFHLFVQRGIELLRRAGRLGFILPNTWLTLQFTDKLRRYVLEKTTVSELVLFDHRVFVGADVHTALLFLSKATAPRGHRVTVRHVPSASSSGAIATAKPLRIASDTWLQSDGCPFETRMIGAGGTLAGRILASSARLEQIARVSLGCQAYNRSKHSAEQIAKRVFHSPTKAGADYLPELAGKDVSRYRIERTRGEWIKYGPWLHDYRTMDWLVGPRVLVREIVGQPPYSIYACYVEETYCNYKTILNVNPSPATKLSMKFLTGVLNSRLMSFLYRFVSNKMIAESFPRLSVGDVKRLPVPFTEPRNPGEEAGHDRLEKLVERMLGLHRDLASAKTPQEKTALERQIAATDAQIDRLVYELYGLTEDEVKIVEKSGSPGT
ncbi:Eco57IR: type IIS restriction enzyme Eco57I [Verrucomicrobia bacterium]|nr:Eco57IR: type IIS restriction enzyme Eco57I [Verrucomicrobiota bacterium]